MSSQKVNTIWLEHARDNLEDAIAVANWSLSNAIIQDIRDEGFSIEADAAQLELNKAMMDPV